MNRENKGASKKLPLKFMVKLSVSLGDKSFRKLNGKNS